ncbi:class II glutamine amidotransferase [Roseobacteraceae bacterium S113]
MCRLTAYIGAPIALEELIIHPAHSLLEQSQQANEAKMAVNGDGFGMAWYDPDHATPGLYRDVLPAWSNGNLADLCRMIRAPLCLAHVRASTFGETARANCHPFRLGAWSCAHNGQIGGFPTRRRALESALPDALYAERAGTTDSEVLFLMLLAAGFEGDPEGATARVLSQLSASQCDAGPTRIALILTQGDALYALRWSSDARSPSLYAKHTDQGTTLSSEPLQTDRIGWHAVPEGALIRFERSRAETLFLDTSPQAA